MDLTMLILQAGPLVTFHRSFPAGPSYTGMYRREPCIPPSHTVLSRSSPVQHLFLAHKGSSTAPIRQ